MMNLQSFQWLFQALLLFHSIDWTRADLVSCREKMADQLEASSLTKHKVNLVLHRSGEIEPCAISVFGKEAFQKASQAIVTECLDFFEKYPLESLLTFYFQTQLVEAGACGSTDNATAPSGLTGYCDMGPDRTTIQPDHHMLVKQPDGRLPCRFFTREGMRIVSIHDLINLADTAVRTMENCEQEDQTCQAAPSLHLYAVAAGRMFMFAPSFVGEKFVLDHVEGAEDKALVLEVINLNPRLFEIYDFFSKDEAQALIDKTLGERSEEYGLHRSRTGATSKTVYNKRTSENAWDTNGETAMEIKSRCMEMLGFDDYWAGHTDGLQILRYQNAQAYVAHHDYLRQQGSDDPYDYDTSWTGGNRFATILLYMTDLGETDGGETLFESGRRPGQSDLIPKKKAVQLLRDSGDPKLEILEPDSWEEEMVAMCRTRLSIQPRAGRAVLFYSQHPNGKQDKSVLHGGCPVLNGTKWAANLWVWNAPRTGNRFAPQKKGSTGPKPGEDLYVTFRNEEGDSRFDKAELFYKDHKNFGSLAQGESLRYKTYKGHVWNIKVDGETLKTYTISGKNVEEVFLI